jgi:myosin heavy subunit
MIYISERWRISIALIVLLLLTGLVYVGNLRAQIKEEEVDFGILATVKMEKGDNLWDLAMKYYDDPYKWTLIQEKNKIPSEVRIPVGTVIYIPIGDAKEIAEEVDEEIDKQKEELKKLADELEKLRQQLRRCNARNRDLTAKNKRLDKVVEDKDAAIKKKDEDIKKLQSMLDNITAALKKMEGDSESELEAQAREMRAAAQAAAAAKEGRGKELAEKDELIESLEAKLRSCRASLERLELARDELRAKIRMAEAAATKPPAAKKKNPKSTITAIAIAIAGSMVWIATR